MDELRGGGQEAHLNGPLETYPPPPLLGEGYLFPCFPLERGFFLASLNFKNEEPKLNNFLLKGFNGKWLFVISFYNKRITQY